MPDVTVRLKVLDGSWEVCGPDRGVWPENFTATADEFGFKTCSFDLMRDPARPWPDLLPFTPVEVEVDGLVVWEGRTIEAPSRDGVMSVQCEGWQHHLDDDLYERRFVTTNLSAFADTRSFLTAPLMNFRAAAQVQAGSGVITLGWSAGTTVGAADAVGVTLDLGQQSAAKRIVVTMENVGFTGTDYGLYAKGTDLPSQIISGGDTAFSYNPASGSSTQAGTLATARRYVSLLLYRLSGTGTVATDVQVRITGVVVAADTAFESGNTSVLKASEVVTDAVTEGTVSLSPDLSGIEATSLSLPEFAPAGLRTPRELIAAVNGLQGWQFKIGAGKRPIYRALPDRPIFHVGDWSAVEVQDAASNSGTDLFNKVVVTGTDPAGQPVRVERYSAFSDPDGFTADPDLYWPNPSFDTNTTGWTGPTRTTTSGQYDTSPAAGKITVSPGVTTAETTATGSPRPGCLYELTIRLKASTSATSTTVRFGAASNLAETSNISVGASGFQTVTVYYRASVGDTSLKTEILFASAGTASLYIDSLTLRVASRTILDRRGVTRARELQVNSTLPSDGVLAAAIGDAWLANHASAPFRGSVTATGPDSVRDRQSGQPIPLTRLLRDTGQLIHFSNRTDPVTGANGTNGRVTEVKWTADTDVAEVTLDNTRQNFETLLNRIAVGQGASQ